jgi:hypothetical protein
MSILEALENALVLLETLGYSGADIHSGGDIHGDLQLAISRLRTKHPQIAKEEL